LRRALIIDAVASGSMGLVLWTAAASLEQLLGLPVDLLRYVGAFLVPFAALLVWTALRRRALSGLIRLIVAGNMVWVVASVLLLVSGLIRPTPLGEVFVLAQAAAVLLFAYLEYRALRDTPGPVTGKRA